MANDKLWPGWMPVVITLVCTAVVSVNIVGLDLVFVVALAAAMLAAGNAVLKAI